MQHGGWHLDRQYSAAGRVDLLTVLAHEIGHVLGYDHSDHASDLMTATLPLDTRRLPGLGQAGIERDLLGPLPRHALLTSPRIAPAALEPLATSLSPSVVSDFELNLLLEPLAGRATERSNSSDAGDSSVLGDVTAEEAALLADDLLELIAGADR